VVARRDERAVDDPAPSVIRIDRGCEQASEAWDQIRHDAMDLRLRDVQHRGELAQGEVGAKTRADDRQATLERRRPRATAPGLGVAKPALELA